MYFHNTSQIFKSKDTFQFLSLAAPSKMFKQIVLDLHFQQVYVLTLDNCPFLSLDRCHLPL
jgi:hypothetical protein